MPMSGPSDLVPISKDVRARLKAEVARTGVTALRLCRMQEGLPPSGIVNRWMKGIAREARRMDLESVLAAYQALPTVDAVSKPRAGRRHETLNSPRIPVTASMGDHIRHECVRTGLTVDAIAAAPGAPQGLVPRIIKGWIYAEAKTARADHWEFVTRFLNNMPHRTPVPPTS